MRMIPYRPRCVTPGCERLARSVRTTTWSGFGRVCTQCYKLAYRNGDPKQQPLRVPEIAPYIRRVSKLIRLTGNRERVEESLKDTARVFTEAMQSPETWASSPMKPWVARWRRKATDEALRVLQDTDPVKSGILVGAVFLLRSMELHRFITPLAFNYQLTRIWRGQTLISYASYWSETAGRVTRLYRDLPRRSTEEIAQYLTTAYERFVRYILEADRKQADSLVPLM